MRPHVSLFASFLMLATCAAPVKLPEAPRVTVPAAPAWSVDTAAASLTQRSCPAGTASVAPTDIAVKADPVSVSTSGIPGCKSRPGRRIAAAR